MSMEKRNRKVRTKTCKKSILRRCRQTWVLNPMTPFTSCVAQDKLFNLTEPGFLVFFDLYSENDTAYVTGHSEQSMTPGATCHAYCWEQGRALPVCVRRDGVLCSLEHSLWRPVFHKQLRGLWGLSPRPSPGRASGPLEEPNGQAGSGPADSCPQGTFPDVCLLYTPSGGWKEEWKLSFLKVKLSTRLRSWRATGRQNRGLPAAGNGSWGRAPHFLWELISLEEESQELRLQPDLISSSFQEWLLNTLAVTFPASDGVRGPQPMCFIHAF